MYVKVYFPLKILNNIKEGTGKMCTTLNSKAKLKLTFVIIWHHDNDYDAFVVFCYSFRLRV